jgi:hypothetical protein
MNKTKPQRIDAKQVKQFLADAHKKAATARKNLPIDAETAYQIAYEAMLKASLALMLSHGQRPRVQLGHHIAIIEFAQKHLSPGLAPIFALFDRIRRKRNEAFYESEWESVNSAVAKLEHYGPTLGRPYVDTLIGSKYPNMKELRVQHQGKPYRILFAFDPRRNAYLILGGDKTGAASWYVDAIRRGEAIYAQHLIEIGPLCQHQ